MAVPASPVVAAAPVKAPAIAQPVAAPPVYVPVVLQPSATKDETHSFLSDATSLVEALAHLGWVIIAVTVLIIFREELKNLLRKLKKGKIFGQEVEFEDDLKKLETKTEGLKEKADTVAETVAETNPPEAPPAEPAPGAYEATEINPATTTAATFDDKFQPQTSKTSQNIPADNSTEPNLEGSSKAQAIDTNRKWAAWLLRNKKDDEISDLMLDMFAVKASGNKHVRYADLIAESAASASQTTLIFLGRQIERELRRALARLGTLNSRSNIPISQGFKELTKYGLMQDLIGSVELFNRIRNAIVHGDVQPSSSEMERALESGRKILATLIDWPAERHVVVATDIPLYADHSLQHLRPFNGIKIADVLPGGKETSIKVFPTLKTSYVPGMEVSWEFDGFLSVETSYYRDPESNVVRAFDRALPFVGRDISLIM